MPFKAEAVIQGCRRGRFHVACTCHPHAIIPEQQLRSVFKVLITSTTAVDDWLNRSCNLQSKPHDSADSCLCDRALYGFKP